MIEALGLRTGKQRVDSTHIMSNIAVLTRLGLFCETIRVFLLAVSREYPGLGEGIGDGLAQRYLKETAEASRYEDARSGEGRRRLSVCARDVYRLVDRFRGTAVAQMDEYEDEDAPERVEIHFAQAVCEPCALRTRCPVGWRSRPELGGEWSRGGAYVLSADLARMNIARRRAAESDGQWRKRYGLRAGIEGTNSEMKRRHGLGRLRVRGGERVRLAVYLKALACNVKRMVGARLIEMDETLARPAALATVPADA